MTPEEIDELARNIGAEGLAHDTGLQALAKSMVDGFGSLTALLKGGAAKPPPAAAQPGAGDAQPGAGGDAQPGSNDGEGSGAEPDGDEEPNGAYEQMGKGGPAEPEYIDATEAVAELYKLAKAQQGEIAELRRALAELKAGQAEHTSALAGVLAPMAKAVMEIRGARGGVAPSAVVEANREGMRQILRTPPPALGADITPERMYKALQTGVISELELRAYKGGAGDYAPGKSARADIEAKILTVPAIAAK